MAGFSPQVRAMVEEREGGRCARCGRPGNQAHHRRPRGSGGSRRPSTNGVANGLWLCPDCHRFIEANRTIALELGWLIAQEDTECPEPADAPLVYRGVWMYLTNDGCLDPVLTPDGDPVHGPPV